MTDKLKELENRRTAACANFCAGVTTEHLEAGWNLPAILMVVAEIGNHSHDSVVRNLARSITRCMGAVVIIQRVDDITISLVEQGDMVAVVSSSNAFRWALLFAGAEGTLAALKALLEEAETVVSLDGFRPRDFHTIRAAQDAVAAAEGGGED